MFNPYLYCLMCRNTNDFIAPAPAFVPQQSSGPSLDIPSQQPSPGKIPPNSAPKKLVFKKQPAVELNKHRRKCEVKTCPNRVVQGGLCIAHGAKRKTCNYPGCTKNVKAQGKCSGHGPPRKVCEEEKCTRVAVQGGKCITHGAKKKCCIVEGCTKQSVLASMCKKHHDQYFGIVKVRAPMYSKMTTSKKKSVSKDQETKG